jgi:hypothetical protein
MQVEDIGKSFTLESLVFISDMTAIATAYTAEGFVIGSDGRKSVAGTPIVGQPLLHPTDDAQKIFAIASPRLNLSYGISGFVRNQAKSFSMIDECAKLLTLVANEEPDCYQCVAEFARRLKLILIDGVRSGLLEPFKEHENAPNQEKRTVSRIILAGYFGSEACLKRARISISRKEDEMLAHEVESTGSTKPGENFATGSDVVPRLAIDGDARFAAYAPYLLKAPKTLQAAFEYVKAYIECCSDSEAASLDPCCKIIGGRVQIARITPIHGFEWFPGFEAVSARMAKAPIALDDSV